MKGAIKSQKHRMISPSAAIARSSTVLSELPVRWNSASTTGTVEAGAGSFESMERSAVTASSIAGSTCQRATPFRIGAAHDMLTRMHLFSDEEGLAGGRGQLGAFCIYPMKRDGEVIGALIAGWNTATDLTRHTAPSIEVLASVAAHALDTAWRLETVQVSARTDALTGLCNRGFLDEQLSRVLSESSRYGDPASLILLDLDYFKSVNDTHGHAVGDMVLKHVAGTLMDGIRGAERRLRTLARKQPRLLWQGLLIAALVWAAQIFEIWLSLRFLGLNVSALELTLVVVAARLALFAPTPGALGALEASLIFAMQSLGYAAAYGLSLGLLIRTRDISFGLVGLLLAGLVDKPALNRS